MSNGKSEQKIPFIPAHETDLIEDTEVIIKRSGIRPILAERLDGRRLPELQKRHGMAPPQVPALPAFQKRLTGKDYAQAPATSWQLSPELTRRGIPFLAGKGFTRKGRGVA